MPPSSMLVNGIDMATFECWVDPPRGWADKPQRRERTLDIQAAGDLLIPSGAKMSGRRWTVSGSIIATTVQDAHDLWDLVYLHLSAGWIEVMILPWTDRVCHCRYEGMQWVQGRPSDDAFKFTLTLYSPNAYLLAPLVDPYAVTPAEPTELLLGSAPCPFVAEFIGPAQRPTLTYFDAQGRVRGTIMLSGDLGAGEWVSFESQTKEMTRHSATGEVADGAPYFDNASDEFVLDPADSVPERGPVLTVDTGTVRVYTRKAFG